MPLVYSVVYGPDGQPVPKVNVSVELIASSDRKAASGVLPSGRVMGRSTLETDRNGRWEIDLVSNDDISPAGTYYRVTEFPFRAPSVTTFIQVPQGPGDFLASQIEVFVPDPPDPVIVGTVQVVDEVSGVYPPRPNGASLVIWRGPDDPPNALEGDVHIIIIGA